MRNALLTLWIGWLAIPLSGAAEWRTFTDIKGRKIEGRVLEVGYDSVIVEIKPGGRMATIPFSRFSGKELASITTTEDAAPVKTGLGAGNAPAAGETDSLPSDDPERSRLYPRTRDEIRTTLREIMKRHAEKGIDKELQEATNTLNAYRFLCGVPYEVKADAQASESATDAALACKKHGDLSHSLGHSTDRCNLSSAGSIVASVTQYVEDGGENNREARGHREWCLNPPMGKVGFGSGGDAFSAMWCMDASGKPVRGIWTYPGRGLFPLDYMHGNAWSLYGVKRPGSPGDLKIEVHRLSQRPEKPFNSTEVIPGREIKVVHVSFGMSAINFEPEEPARKGIYWVRVKGGGVSEGWLVEFY